MHVWQLQEPFAMIISLSELYFRFRRFILLVQMIKLVSLNYWSNTNNWKPWRRVRLDPTLLTKDIYTNPNLNLLTKFTSNSRSTEFKDNPPWSISQMITNTVPVSTRIVISYAMKWGISMWFFLIGIHSMQGWRATTVKPVYNDHLGDEVSVVVIDRWSL